MEIPFIELHVSQCVGNGTCAARDGDAVDRAESTWRRSIRCRKGRRGTGREDKTWILSQPVHRLILRTPCFAAVQLRLGGRVHDEVADRAFLVHRAHAVHSLSMINVALPCRDVRRPPVPWARARRQLGTCTLGVRFTAQLAHRFDDLGDAAAIGGVVVAQHRPPAVGVERQLADA